MAERSDAPSLIQMPSTLPLSTLNAEGSQTVWCRLQKKSVTKSGPYREKPRKENLVWAALLHGEAFIF